MILAELGYSAAPNLLWNVPEAGVTEFLTASVLMIAAILPKYRWRVVFHNVGIFYSPVGSPAPSRRTINL